MNASQLPSQISKQIPAALAVAERLGIQTRRLRRKRMAQGAGLFGAGIVLGSGLAVLLSPRSGAETRRRIGARLAQARDYIKGEVKSELAAGDGKADSGSASKAA